MHRCAGGCDITDIILKIVYVKHNKIINELLKGAMAPYTVVKGAKMVRIAPYYRVIQIICIGVLNEWDLSLRKHSSFPTMFPKASFLRILKTQDKLTKGEKY